METVKKIKNSLVNFIKEIKTTIADGVCSLVKSPNFFKNFAFTYAIYFFGLLSILQANFLYKTDIQRVAERGESNWRHSGRFLNDLFVYIFHFDSYPRDISPLSQLIGVVFLTFSSLILVRLIAKKESYLALFFSSVLGLSPYFLQVISYNFDCLFYCASVFFVVFPFLFYKNNKTFYFTSVIGILFTYMSWQASISVYMITAAYLFWRDFCNKDISLKQLMKKVIMTVLVFLLSSLFYVGLVHWIPVKGSVIVMQGSFCKLSECLDVFSKNFKEATNGYFFLHWKNTPMGYAFLAIIASFTLYVLKTSFQSAKSKKMYLINDVIGVLCVCCMLFFIVLWTMFFPFIYWNARIWVGFGACFVIMMLAMTNERARFLRKIMMLFCFILTWGCIVFAARVGNLMDVQKRYESFVLTSLSQDLTHFPKVKEYFFVQRNVHSPVVMKHARKYPILSDLVTGMQTHWVRIYAYFTEFHRPDMKACRNKKIKYKKVLLNNPLHKFTQINDTCVQIDLK